MSAEHFKEVFSHFFIQDLAPIKILKQDHHLTRGGNVFSTLAGSFQVHHLATQASTSEAERGHQAVDVFHTHTIDQDIGSAVIANRHHHCGQIAQCDPGDAGSETAHDVAIRD